MTPRQRFHATMTSAPRDRVPWLEEGLRDDVLEQWRRQGLGAGEDLAKLFHYDRRERIEVNLGPQPGLSGVPRTAAGLRALEKSLDPLDPVRLPADWAERVQRWGEREHILELPLHSGLFLTLGARDWASVEPVLYLLADEPELVRQIMDAHARLIAAVADRVLSEVQIDFASFSEPIGGNNGPMVSPSMYRRIVLDSYRPIMEVLCRHRVETVVFMTYANARCLLGDVLDAGFNCLWAMETETEAMDYLALRREFGQRLRLIGGIDLDALRGDEQTIRREVCRKVPALLEQGGYIPLADGRVRAAVPFANYVCYRRALEQVTMPR